MVSLVISRCHSGCDQLHVVIVGVVYALKAKDRDYVMEFTAFLFGNINEEGELENEDLLGRVSDVEILVVLKASMLPFSRMRWHS